MTRNLLRNGNAAEERVAAMAEATEAAKGVVRAAGKVAAKGVVRAAGKVWVRGGG